MDLAYGAFYSFSWLASLGSAGAVPDDSLDGESSGNMGSRPRGITPIPIIFPPGEGDVVGPGLRAGPPIVGGLSLMGP